MKKINQIDYYCGAFLSYLVSNGVEPTFFEAGDKSRVVEFLIKNITYKAYLKYSTVKKATRSTSKKGKDIMRWDINFSADEVSQIEGFDKTGKEMILVFICTDDTLKNTDIVVLSYTDACQCMGIGQDSINKQRRISILCAKNARSFKCYGTGLMDKNAIEVLRDLDKIFQIGDGDK